jgi:hypothetical protein
LDLFKACERWAKEKPRPRDAIGRVLGLIRFRTFTVQEFARHVVPSRLFYNTDNSAIFCFLVTWEGYFLEGFTNQFRPRCIKGNEETIVISTKLIPKTVRAKEISNGQPFRFSLNSDGYILKGQINLYEIPSRNGCSENLQVYLRNAESLVIASAICKNCSFSDFFTFRFKPSYVALNANVTYALHVFISHLNMSYSLRSCHEQILTTKSDLKTNLQKLDINPVHYLTIAKKT